MSMCFDDAWPFQTRIVKIRQIAASTDQNVSFYVGFPPQKATFKHQHVLWIHSLCTFHLCRWYLVYFILDFLS